MKTRRGERPAMAPGTRRIPGMPANVLRSFSLSELLETALDEAKLLETATVVRGTLGK